jgi:alkanesulfonate monooxygenase SsuD/methylene tetrahydromethanopterin reductase-like flavin-dependent oxidoreductase (luciferase family)
MKVFIFDLLPYDHHFENYKQQKLIPYPLSREHWDPEIGARTYEQHLAIWEEMDKLGFDGVGLNEHHTTPHGLMISPNMMAAAAAQRTKNLKFLILGNLLPIHNPLRIAEELAMADCMSRGRILSGFARGVPREYNVYNVPMAESRARFEEAVDIIMKAWTEPQFSHDGKYWPMKDIAIWPRPYQQPHPPVWIPFTGSKETIEWAGRHNLRAVLFLFPAYALASWLDQGERGRGQDLWLCLQHIIRLRSRGESRRRRPRSRENEGDDGRRRGEAHR